MHRWRPAFFVCSVALLLISGGRPAIAAGGLLRLHTEDESTQRPVVARFELFRPDGKPQPIRRVIQAGQGVILNESIGLELPDGDYRFRLTRGPEYRVVIGEFTLERTSQDERTVKLPRMVEMEAEGWISCDLAVPPQTADLKLRMMAEDVHLACVIGEELPETNAQLMPQDDSPYLPLWTMHRSSTSSDGDLVFYQHESQSDKLQAVAGESSAQAIDRIAAVDSARIAVANPFAWLLPVWIASGQIDGYFVLGDWLREDRRVEKIVSGRPPQMIGFDGPRGPGRYAESIYWNLLEAGLRIAPLAGTATTPRPANSSAIGYNRVYVTGQSGGEDADSHPALNTAAECLAAALAGCSVITNGPMLRPSLAGYRPGHVFHGSAGEVLTLEMVLSLSVRDEVDYLEIIHNGRVFYSARLDEFAAAGGRLPELQIDQSGWALVRVVTRHEDHFRMASSAPWYFEFDGQPRISRQAVKFFGRWLVDCESRLKTLPADQLAKHVPHVVGARKFWTQRLSQATAD